MLEHCFLLSEFKFVFEFYLFESLPKYLCLIPKPSTYPTPSNSAAQHPQPALARVAAQHSQPRSPAAAGRSSSVPRGSPTRIDPPAGPAKPPARFPRRRSPAEADRWGYPSSPTRGRPRPGLDRAPTLPPESASGTTPALGPHAKDPSPGYLKPRRPSRTSYPSRLCPCAPPPPKP
jgi:hypothetical protein